MALRKLTFEDIRVSPGLIVIAAPKWAYTPDRLSPKDMWVFPTQDGGFVTHPKGEPKEYRQIPELWVDVEAELKRKRAKREAERQAEREHYTKIVNAPGYDSNKSPWPMIWLKADRDQQRHRKPGDRASIRWPRKQALRTCPVCDQEFFGLGSTAVCTEKCAEARRAATRTRGATPRPLPVFHENRPCQQCREPFRPRRADAVFCSSRCRVYHYRDQARAHGT